MTNLPSTSDIQKIKEIPSKTFSSTQKKIKKFACVRTKKNVDAINFFFCQRQGNLFWVYLQIFFEYLPRSVSFMLIDFGYCYSYRFRFVNMDRTRHFALFFWDIHQKVETFLS